MDPPEVLALRENVVLQEDVVSPELMDPQDPRVSLVTQDQLEISDRRVAKETQVPLVCLVSVVCEDLVDSLVLLAKQVDQEDVAPPELMANQATKAPRVSKVFQAPWVFPVHKGLSATLVRKVPQEKPVQLDHVVTLARTAQLGPSVNLVLSAPQASEVLPVLLVLVDSKVFPVPPEVTVQLERTENLVSKAHVVSPAVLDFEVVEASQESEELKVPQEKLEHEENQVFPVLTVHLVQLVHLDKRAMLVHLVLLVFLAVVVPSVFPEKRENEDPWVALVPKVLPVAKVTKVLRVSWVL